MNTQPKQEITCSRYRHEMVLLALTKQLNNSRLSDSDRKAIERQIKNLEKEMGWD